MSKQAKKEEKNIWDVVFQPHRPVRVTFDNDLFENDYIYEGKDDNGVFVSHNKKVYYIPWFKIDYLAWVLSDESKKEKGEGDASV